MLFPSTVKMKHNTNGEQKSNTTKCVTCKNTNDRFWYQHGNSNSLYQLPYISLAVSPEKLAVHQYSIPWLMNFFISHESSLICLTV